MKNKIDEMLENGYILGSDKWNENETVRFVGYDKKGIMLIKDENGKVFQMDRGIAYSLETDYFVAGRLKKEKCKNPEFPIFVKNIAVDLNEMAAKLNLISVFTKDKIEKNDRKAKPITKEEITKLLLEGKKLSSLSWEDDKYLTSSGLYLKDDLIDIGEDNKFLEIIETLQEGFVIIDSEVTESKEEKLKKEVIIKKLVKLFSNNMSYNNLLDYYEADLYEKFAKTDTEDLKQELKKHKEK